MDLNRLAKSIVDQPTTDEELLAKALEKNVAAVSLGRLGGLKGGKARAASLSAEQRSEIAKKAAECVGRRANSGSWRSWRNDLLRRKGVSNHDPIRCPVALGLASSSMK